MKKRMILILCIFATGKLLAQDLTVDEIISKYLNANSQDKLMEIETIKMRGAMNQQGIEFKVIGYQKKPDKIRQDMEVQGVNVIVVIDGESGWTVNPMATGSSDPQDLPVETIKSVFWEEIHINPILNWKNPFMNWKENGTVELVGKEDLDGRPVYNLKFIFENNLNLAVNYFIDAEKYVVLSQKSLRTQMGQTYEQEDRYDDYRNINGILCPFLYKTLINGQVQSSATLDSCEFDISIDDSFFRKPVKDQE